MNTTVARPTALGRWSLLGPPGSLHCPVGHLLAIAGEKSSDLKGKSDPDTRQLEVLRNHYGLGISGVRSLMGLCQIECDVARADKAARLYESFGISVDPPTPDKEGADVG